MIKSDLTNKYKKQIASALTKEFGYKTPMQVPTLDKIVINACAGDATQDSKFLDSLYNEITLITGQKPVKTKSKKAIASFKLRENQEIGIKVTLRREKMWNFVEKLVNIALPRVRDFRGLKASSFDGKGNFTLGIKEQNIFTEINFDDIKRVRGFDVTFVTSTNSNKEAQALLMAIGLPFIGTKKQQIKESK